MSDKNKQTKKSTGLGQEQHGTSRFLQTPDWPLPSAPGRVLYSLSVSIKDGVSFLGMTD